MLGLIPVFMITVFAFAFTGYFVQIKSRVRSTCLIETIKIQKHIIASEKKLFALNPLSTSLRLRLAIAYAELATAIDTYNVAAATKATYEIESITQQREELEHIQKALINGAQNLARIEVLATLSKIISHFNEMSLIWKFYLYLTNSIQIARSPKIAVSPDFDDTAPNYGLDSEYKTTQQVVLYWQHHLRTNNESQRLLASENSYEFSCGAGVNKKGEKWTIEIKGDRF